jgi:predicted acylesterase/phospholipase RssA
MTSAPEFADGRDPDRLLDPATYAHADRECDVVMKGGITSGVVYPLAVCELAETYRLRNVGGTSAGAIAAAAAAAAEHGRSAPLRTDPPPGSGFPGLAVLPTWLATGTNLLDLFQPSRSTARIYRLLLAAIRHRSGPLAGVRRVGALLGRLLSAALFTRYALILVLASAPGVVVLWRLDGARYDRLIGAGILAGVGLGMGALAALNRPRSREPLAPCMSASGPTGTKEANAGTRRWSLLAILVLVIGVVWVLHRAAGSAAGAWGLAAGWLLLIGGVGLGAIVSTVLGAGRSLPRNLYGLVAGAGTGGTVAISDWLSRLLNQLAGRPPTGPPLTFGDLRGGPAESPSADAQCDPRVNLEMLTTCLTQGRPYRLPNDLDRSWFFDEGEFCRLFPAEVVGYLTDYTHADLPKPSEQADWERLVAAGKADGLHPLPDPDGLPVVVAARMSLSFPVLISAVPLYAVDRTCLADDGSERLERCWFSDGGITSNFPVSFFDTLLPRRPTFGINLRNFHPAHPPSENECENVWMPRTNSGGLLEVWHRKARSSGIGAVAEFLAAILDTMQNWVDNRQLQVPGFRDRIVHIAHRHSEGGMNLDMPTDVLAKLSERGQCAGARLVEYYTIPPEADRDVSWENHRWVRMRSALGLVEECLIDLADAFEPEYAADLQRDLDDAPSYQFDNRAQRDLARNLMRAPTAPQSPIGTAGLVDLGRALAAFSAAKPTSALRSGTPSPRPRLTVSPGHERRCAEPRREP